MKKFNNWILNAISGSQTDKNETTEESEKGQNLSFYMHIQCSFCFWLVTSNIFIHILEPELINYHSNHHRFDFN